MKETTEQFTAGGAAENAPAADPDKTLAQPRFDAVEARTAQPVVPLAEAGSSPWRRSSLPILLILVSAIVGGLVSVLAYRTYQQRRSQPPVQEAQQMPEPAAQEQEQEQTPTPEVAVVAVETEAAPPVVEEQPTPEPEVEDAETPAVAAAAGNAAREERAKAEAERRPEAEARAPRRAGGEAARPERPRETERPRRVDRITGPVGERVSRRERADDSDLENEATDYETPAERRERRRAARRAARRNVDRVRAIFEGDPPR